MINLLSIRTVAMLAALALAACSATGELRNAQPQLAGPLQPGSVFLEDSRGGSTRPEAQIFRQSLVNRLRVAGVFTRIVQNPRRADYLMRVDVFRIDTASAAELYFSGYFSDGNAIKAAIEIRDARRDRIVTAFQVSGEGTKSLLTDFKLSDAMDAAQEAAIAYLRTGQFD
ncbi:MAG: hypothetical protein AAF360_14465 [Pseudomonadota bacterium]